MRKKADTIMKFDFSTPYTKISQNKLLKVMYELIGFCFDGGGIALNDRGEFEKPLYEIHPPELELKKKNTSRSGASFLDLNIKISDRKCKLGLYDQPVK